MWWYCREGVENGVWLREMPVLVKKTNPGSDELRILGVVIRRVVLQLAVTPAAAFKVYFVWRAKFNSQGYAD